MYRQRLTSGGQRSTSVFQISSICIFCVLAMVTVVVFFGLLNNCCISKCFPCFIQKVR